MNNELFERLLNNRLEEIHWELSALESEAEELVQALSDLEDEEETEEETDEAIEISDEEKEFLEWLISKYVK